MSRDATSRGRRALEWCVWNAAFGVGLVLGVVLEIKLAGWLVVAFVWLMLGLHALVLLSAPGKDHSDPVPWLMARGFDAAVVALTLAFAWYATAAAYGVSMVLQAMIYRRRAPKSP